MPRDYRLFGVATARSIEHVFAVLDELQRAIEKAAASEHLLDLPRLRKLIDQLDAVWLGQVRAAERAGVLDDVHAGPARVLAETCRLGFRQASRDVHAARALEALPRLTEAFKAGQASALHTRLVSAAVTADTRDHIGGFDEQLTQWACQPDTRALRQVIHRVKETIAADGGIAHANDLYAQRRLHVSPSLDGVGFVDGQLDPEGTEIVLSALEHRMDADPDRDTDPRRSRPQRRADAIVDICRHYLRTHDAAAPTGARRGQPHISGVVSVEMLERHAPTAFADHNDLDHTGSISAETWRRLTCDCAILRIVMRGRGEVLDVGRATRTVPAPLWRALVARDKHCTRPGCTMPAAYCDAHHITHWADGDPTNLDNLALLCWRHHRQHHEGHSRAGP